MTDIKRGNWSFQDPGDAVPDGSTITNGNFSQLVPDTEILVGKTLTITGGNWCNVARQPEWTVTGGNWGKLSRCSNIHPEWIVHGLIECVENCEHVSDVDYVYIDGELVDTFYTYEDKVI